jgi:hypothetical protein
MVNGWLNCSGLPRASPRIGTPNRRPVVMRADFATKTALTAKANAARGAQKSFWIKRFLVY